MNLFGVLFALAAAILWLLSALVHVPILQSGWGTLVTQMKDGSTVKGEAPFYAALNKVARLNATAAACAFFSTLLQAFAQAK
jgi:hypothetical protein